jgi:hypothetical protein
MRQSYAVWWREGDSPRNAGKVQLGPLHLLLSNGSSRLSLPVDGIVAVDYRRGELHIERRDGMNVHIGNLDGPGVLFELGDALASRSANQGRSSVSASRRPSMRS